MIVSVFVLHVAVSASKDQEATSRSQRNLNILEQQHYESRYASRVAMSDPLDAKGDIVIRIENRSFALIRDLAFLDNARRVAIFAGNLSACSAIEMNITETLGVQPKDVAVSWFDGMLVFHDPDRAWVLDARGLRTSADFDVAPFLMLAKSYGHLGTPIAAYMGRDGDPKKVYPFPPNATYREHLADCGE
jgi:hypothetical protein